MPPSSSRLRRRAVDRCGGLLKPDVVFFGENVPRDRYEQACEALAGADALLVAGSSLMVYSGFRFVRLAHEAGLPIAILNRGRTRGDDLAELKIEGDVGATLTAAVAVTRPMAADPMNMSPSRRRFLTGVTSAAVGIAVARPGCADDRQRLDCGVGARSEPWLSWRQAWRGTRGGGDQALLVSARTFRDGEPAGGARPPARRGAGRGHALEGILDRQVRSHAGPVEAADGKIPGQAPVSRVRRGRALSRSTGSTSTEAEAYCAELSRSAHRSGVLPEAWEFRLPTEAQWEYACRAGTSSATSFGDSLARHQANFAAESADRSVRAIGGARTVGSYPANPWGIHDMHGNVWEWCRDYYHPQLPGRDGSRSLRPEGHAATGTARIPACVAAAPGSSPSGPAARRAACATNRPAAPITSASVWSWSSGQLEHEQRES